MGDYILGSPIWAGVGDFERGWAGTSSCDNKHLEPGSSDLSLSYRMVCAQPAAAVPKL